MNHRETLRHAEKNLALGPVAMAAELNTPYHTYKDWRSGRRKMPGIAYKAVELLQRVRAARQT